MVDARMLHASGIGTVLQNVLPVLSEKYRLVLLGNPTDIKQYAWAANAEVITFEAPIYSIAEQVQFPFVVPACDVFLSPHFNVPFLPVRAKRRAVIIHDVYHLASKTIHPLHKLYARLLLTAAVSFSDSIVTISDFTASEIRKFLRPGGKTIHKITLGVDSGRFNMLPLAPETIKEVRAKYKLPAKFLLFVGNVKPHKNLIRLVEALALLSGEVTLPLVIVGKKEGFLNGDENLHKTIKRLQLEDRIHFTGFVDDAHLPVLYRLAEIFVFPSLYEGFGLPPVEAMASGCATVVSGAASLPEVCQNASLYVEATNPDQIATAIKRILQDEMLRNDLVAKGLQLAQKYTWDKTGEELLKILSSGTEGTV